jgi:transcriptional regulator with XRE-family HTH domain
VEIAERFASNLIEQRKTAGLSQEELAFRADLHRTQISLLETGKRVPRLDTVLKLVGALEVPITTLVEGIAWEPIVRVTGGFRVSDPR